MNRIAGLLFLFIICHNPFAYCNTDSLLTVVNSNVHDTLKVDAYNKLARQYLNSEPDKALKYAADALSLSAKIFYRKGISQNYVMLGILYKNRGDYARSVDYTLRGMQIAEKQGFKEILVPAYVNIGNVKMFQEDHKTAAEYYNLGINIARQINNKRLIYLTLNSLGGVMISQARFDSAAVYFSEARQLSGMAKDSLAYLQAQGNLGLSLFHLANYNESEKLISASISLADRLGIERVLAENQYNLANLYRRTGKYEIAIPYYKKSLATGLKLSELNLQKINYEGLSAVMSAAGKHAEAYRYSMLYNSISDSLAKSETVKKQTQLEMNYDFDKREAIQQEIVRQQQAEQQAKIERERLLRNGFLLIGVLLLIIAYVLFNQYKVKKKANAELSSTLENLRATQQQLIQAEKMASLGMLTSGIAHEIQNPLNFVNNFSQLSVDLVKELKEEPLSEDQVDVADMLEQNLEKINHHGNRANIIVKSMLELSKTGSGNKEISDLQHLVYESIHAAQRLYKRRNIDFDVKIEFNSKVKLNIPIIPADFNRALLNILDNALYATEEKKSLQPGFIPAIHIDVERIQNLVEIRITDNGTGIPEEQLSKIFVPFFTTKPTGKGNTGLGLSLAYESIVKGHNGEMIAESNSSGTVVIIRLPV